MFTSFSTWIVDRIQKNGLVLSKDAEIYIFGFQTIFLKMLHVATMLLVGFSFHKMKETILFMIVYSLIRTYAGGFHAKTKKGCYLISWVIIISVLLALCKTNPKIDFIIPCILICCLLISLLSPLGSENKPLDTMESKHYKKSVNIILIFYLVLTISFFILRLYCYLFVISLSLQIELLMLVIRKIQIHCSLLNKK